MGWDDSAAPALRHGADAKADLPEPAILLILITTILAVGFGALGGWLRERAMRSAPERT